MFVYAILRAVRLGFLDDADGGKVVSMKKTYEYMTANWVLPQSDATMNWNNTVVVGSLQPGNDYEYYISQTIDMNDLKGLSAFVLASLEYELFAKHDCRSFTGPFIQCNVDDAVHDVHAHGIDHIVRVNLPFLLGSTHLHPHARFASFERIDDHKSPSLPYAALTISYSATFSAGTKGKEVLTIQGGSGRLCHNPLAAASRFDQEA
ncbi:hypothetical protein EW146_g4519 [Bondarzewia mesenterica]|uniref:Uncharacterized protein n=1 Tax=Bondarzewia mesenterica TaxID=1095465 RepID=A0A4S4LUA7_9AGAM|nr:hypothetical protein EW146_g4519 [Bondarzewia mesenterica]